MSGKIDVVYPIGTGSRWSNNELRYSLRALEKNFLDLGRVFIVGTCPPWLTGVERIDAPDNFNYDNKDANLIDKVNAACAAGISDPFVRSSDDELLLQPMHAEDLKPYHAGPLACRSYEFWNGNVWNNRLRRTYRVLLRKGLPTLHHDTHIPTLCDRALWLKVVESYDYHKGIGYTINTLFLNHLPDVWNRPAIKDRKITLYRRTSDIAKLREQIAGKMYLNYNDNGLTPALKQLLQELFPTPSRWESDGEEYNSTFSPAHTELPMVVAVIGAPRSGTSCTAGIIHHLGVSMGNRFRKVQPHNPKGFFEAIGLRRVCADDCEPGERIAKFRRWARRRADERIIGGKEGKLCNFVPEIVKAWPRLKVVAVERPVPEIVASMGKSGTFTNLSPAGREAYAKRFLANRDRDLERYGVDTLRLPFAETIKYPAGAIAKLVDFLGIHPTAEQIQAAREFVDPSMKHNNIDSTQPAKAAA